MIISERTPTSSLIRILLLVVIGGWMIIGQVLGVLAGSLIYDGDFLTAMADPVKHTNLRTALLLSQGIASAIGLIFIPWFYLKTAEHLDARSLFRDEQHWPIVMIAIVFGVMGMAAAISPIAEWNANVEFPEWMSGFGEWAKRSEDLAAEIIKSITTNLTPSAFILTFIVVAIIPAIGEELVFRGLIQNELTRAFKNPHVGIWLAATLFSAIHFQFMGFIPRVLLGAFFGYLYYWSGNLWIPIIGHFFNNGIQIIALYLYQKELIPIDPESTERAPIAVVATSFLITVLILFFLKNHFSSRSNPASGPV